MHKEADIIGGDWERIRKLQEEVMENSKLIIRNQQQIAHMNKAYFEGLLCQGFSEEQAMRLVETQTAALYGARNEE